MSKFWIFWKYVDRGIAFSRTVRPIFAHIAVTYILLAFLWTVCHTVAEELDGGARAAVTA